MATQAAAADDSSFRGQGNEPAQDDSQDAQQQQQNRQSEEAPPSPPLPQRHTAATPGVRAQRLQELYGLSLRKVLGNVGWDNFAACFPTVASNAPGMLKELQGQMVGKLGDKCEKEFENIMVARQVVPKLNELDSLDSDAKRRSALAGDREPPTPPHLLPPSDILAAHLAPTLASHQSRLNARLQTTQSQNALLYDEVRRQRSEIDDLLAALEHVTGDVRAASDAIADSAEELAREARQGEAALIAAEELTKGG